ncbi:MAG: hypothetical protein JHD15_04435 [Phenylobacterium sp.]|jgi:hypothetical protein|uniref:hypothetical protein n=1 Tax=unclassified Phenylobacterium TaxID=2640670 RepID=UPI0008C397D6|nr:MULTISPECIES: hypothetical protein [unclassified Phenylobacterium]MBJ7409600.1 hypothetical protein [Phenylobacterium sp.]OHB26169.1 MAG: hypothetical protein A2790_19560 [Phenylobacterium sp. RIFCSPHIGHO2_01_FULL_69_31]
MPHTPAWRSFKRTQDLTVATAALIYAGAVAHAFGRLPGGSELIVQRTLIWPAVFLSLSFTLPLLIGPVRRPLTRYVWMSFQAGFGQNLRSILYGVALLGGAAGLIYWQISNAANGGRYPAGVFSGYAAGIGILAAQAALVRVLEKHPDVRKQIEL